MPAYTSSVALDDLSNLPKVAIVHMEHAPESHWRASGDVEVGVPVVPTLEAHGKTYYTVGGKVRDISVYGASASAQVAGMAGRLGIAMNETGVMTPAQIADEDTGPVEVTNADVTSGSWVRVFKKGTFFTTLLEAVSDFDAAYVPGTMVTYDATATRATTIAGSGAYVATTDRDAAIGFIAESKMVIDEGSTEVGYASVTLF